MGYVFMMSGAAVSWEAKNQICVALSSTEAEYIASKEAVFIKGFLNEFIEQNKPLVLFNDSQRTKHIDTKYHYIRNVVDDGVISIEYLPTQKMIADVFTKGLHAPKHVFYIKNFGLY